MVAQASRLCRLKLAVTQVCDRSFSEANHRAARGHQRITAGPARPIILTPDPGPLTPDNAVPTIF
jgi:hypothetical protein